MANLTNPQATFEIIQETLLSIAASLKDISADPWTKYGTIVSTIVAVIALYTANKEYYNDCVFKPKISLKIGSTLKQGNLFISRLNVVNVNRKMAKNVSFWAEKLWHLENGEWIEATNFLQFPLRWTHATVEDKNLLPARPYPLDICEVFYNDNAFLDIHLLTLPRSPMDFGLDDLRAGKNRLQITLYSENHEKKHYYLEILWDGFAEGAKMTLSQN